MGNVKKNIEKKVKPVVACLSVVIGYDKGEGHFPILSRPIVDRVDNWIDEKNNMLIMFGRAGAFEDYMIESGNFRQYWNEDMRESVTEELEEKSDCWEIDDERMDSTCRYDAPREKVYYMGGVMDIEDMLWYKWKIPIKRIQHAQI